MANPLGSSLVQTPAILPYLPVIARHLLGEELQLPSVETFWCGDSKMLPYVLGALSDLDAAALESPRLSDLMLLGRRPGK